MTALTTPPSDLRVHDEPVTRPKRLARIAGGLYLLLAVLGGLAQLYVRPRAVVPADPAATAANVAADTSLFQLFFAGELVSITAFLLVAMVLYRLLKHVDRDVAAAMVTFVAVAAAIMSLNMLNHYSKRAASIGMPQAQGRWCGGSAERRSRRSPDRPGRSEPVRRCRSPVAGDGLMAFEIARVFDAPLDEVFQYPNGGD